MNSISGLPSTNNNNTTNNNNNSKNPSKRLAPIAQTAVFKRRSKPKRLRLEETSDTSNNNVGENTTKQSYHVKDVYEFDHLQFHNSINIKPNVRPLPGISDMINIAPQQRVGSGVTGQMPRKKQEPVGVSKIPLLNDFFVSLRKFVPDDIGKKIEEDSLLQDDDQAKKEGSTLDVDNTLNQFSTILTDGHHKRFKELLSEMEKGVYADDKQRKRRAFSTQRVRKKELLKLCDLFREERRLYAIALEKFQVDNADKFLTGFRIAGPASQFVNVNAENVKRWAKRWQNARKPNIASDKYGPYTQAISLQGISNETEVKSVGAKTFNPIVVHRDTDCLPNLKSNWRESMLKRKKLRRSIVTEPAPTLLCEDDVAKSLALKHNVDIVLTSDTLEALLRHPEATDTRWTIPLSCVDVGTESCQNLIMFMEDPLPGISTPRECLSIGIKEALISHAVDTIADSSNIQGKNTYTLLTIPYPTGEQRVLVRSCNYLLDENGKPLIMFSQLEYFSEQCGIEEFTTHDHVVWLLHKILQDDCTIVVGRVDTISGEVLELEEKTVADALTTNEISVSERYLDSLGAFEKQDGANDNATSLFYRMSTVLSATLLIEKKTEARHIICLPGRSNIISPQTTATVHKAQLEGSNISIDVDKELNENAASVLLNKSTLQSCFRRWQWKSDRLPYTFALKDKS